MSLLRKSVFGGALFIATATGAVAADAPGGRSLPYPEPAPPPTFSPRQSEPFAGWYLRGDVGYRMQDISSANSASGFASPTNNKVNSTVVAGFGAGYKSGWLRSDLTVDFTPSANYTGQVASPGDVGAKVTATTLLLNGYLDLGSWYRMTPYVGAGVGMANMNISDYKSTVSPPFGTVKSRGQTNLAWAGMAGVAYALSQNVLVDVSYRYLSLGDATTSSDTFGAMRLSKITAQEVRVGLRWNFDDQPLGR